MLMENRDRELIQGYIEGNLTLAEESEINYRLKDDSGLQQMLSEYRSLALGIRFSHMHEKLEQLRSLEVGLPPVEDNVFSIRSYWMPLATAAIILISLSTWFFLSDSQPTSNEALYAAYFEPFDSPGSGLTRSTDDEMTLKAKAYRAYDSKNYEEAAKLFTAVLQEKDDAIVQLCLGNTWLALDKPAEAEKVFQHILENHGDLVTQAKWYLAMTFLRQEKIERTKATLWEISDSSTYGKEAKELLKKLE
jgi:hypothetical protein